VGSSSPRRHGSCVAPARAALRLCCAAAFLLCLSACSMPTQTPPSSYYPAIQASPSPAPPTPEAAAFEVGAWPSNASPHSGGAVTIFVLFRSAGIPVAGAQVTVNVRYGYVAGSVRTDGGSVQTYGSGPPVRYGPIATDGSGYAHVAVLSASPAHPAQVDVTVSYQGQTYSTSTSFAATP
jgi:hypothetical protein